MQFAVLVYEKPGTYEALSAAELEQMTAEYFAIAELPGYIGGAQLQSIETASAVRVQARNVRSLANVNRASGSESAAGGSPSAGPGVAGVVPI